MDEVIDLRQLMEILWRGRRLIAVTTLGAMLLAGVLGFFVLPPNYEATATVLVNVPTDPPKTGEDVLGRPFVSMSLDAYRQQVVNPTVLANVIADLKLQLTPDQLARKIRTSVPKGTTQIQITVKDQDPKVAADIANAVAKHYRTYVENLHREHVRQVVASLEEQISAEQERLTAALAQLKDGLARDLSADVLGEELEAKVSQLAVSKARLAQLSVEIEMAEATLAAARSQLARVPQRLTITRAVLEDSYLQGLAMELGDADMTQLSDLQVTAEEVNPVWVTVSEAVQSQEMILSRLQAEQRALQEMIAHLEKEVGELEALVAEKSVEQGQLQAKVDLSLSTIKDLNQKLQKVQQGASVAEAALAVVSEAAPPEKPAGPPKALYVVLAGFMGAFASVAVVLLREIVRGSSHYGGQFVSSGKNS